MLYFSATENSFYASEIHGTAIPKDAKQISDELHAELMTAQSQGKKIKADANGYPIAVDAEAPPYEQLATAYLDSVRAIREDILNRLAGIGFASLATSNAAAIAAVAAARQSLLDITQCAGVLAATDVDGLKTAVIAEYRRIAAATPIEVQKAFLGMDV